MRVKLPDLPWASLGARSVSVGANVTLALVFAALFGADHAGSYFLAFTIINLIAMVARLGTENELLRTIPSIALSEGPHAVYLCFLSLARIAGRSTVAIGAAALATACIGYAVTGGPAWQHLLILAGTIPLAGFSVLVGTLLRSTGRVPLGTLLESGLVQLLSLLLAAGAWFMGVHDAIVMSFATVSSGVIVTSIAVSAAWRIRTQARRVNSEPVAVEVPSWRIDGVAMIFMMTSSVTYNAMISAPIIYLGLFAPSEEVAYYNAAARLASLVALIPTFQAPHLLPQVASDLGSGEIAQASQRLASSARVAAGLGLVIALALSAISLWSLCLGADVPARVATALMILAWGQVVVTAFGQVNPLMALTRLGQYSTISALIAIAVFTPLYVLLASASGAVGVAAVYIFSLIVCAAYGNSILAKHAELVPHALGASRLRVSR